MALEPNLVGDLMKNISDIKAENGARIHHELYNAKGPLVG